MSSVAGRTRAVRRSGRGAAVTPDARVRPASAFRFRSSSRATPVSILRNLPQGASSGDPDSDSESRAGCGAGPETPDDDDCGFGFDLSPSEEAPPLASIPRSPFRSPLMERIIACDENRPLLRGRLLSDVAATEPARMGRSMPSRTGVPPGFAARTVLRPYPAGEAVGRRRSPLGCGQTDRRLPHYAGCTPATAGEEDYFGCAASSFGLLMTSTFQVPFITLSRCWFWTSSERITEPPLKRGSALHSMTSSPTWMLSPM